MMTGGKKGGGKEDEIDVGRQRLRSFTIVYNGVLTHL